MSTHHVRLNQIAAGRYCVTGAVSIANTTTPIPDAAAALKAAGADDSDTIAVACGEITILPMSLGSILKFRPTSHRHGFLREMLGIPPR
jgi:hypothetical protein